MPAELSGLELTGFRCCPHCGSAALQAVAGKAMVCGDCGWRYFHNAAAAVAALIRCGQQVLRVQRAIDPGKGLWDLPGGFVDYGENLESALARELQEELALAPVTAMRYLGSAANSYPYAGTRYQTCDAYFLIDITRATQQQLQAQDDVAALEWSAVSAWRADDFAFASLRAVLPQLGLWLA